MEPNMSGLIETPSESREHVDPQIPRRLFNVDEYYKLAEIGVLRPEEHLELLQGEIFEKFPPALRLFTADEYEKMAEAGILDEDEHVELIAGRILEMSPKGIGHAVSTNRANRCFLLRLGTRVVVRGQNPIRLDNASEPEPDLVLAKPQEREYADRHPTPSEILLVLEVADSSLTYDRNAKSRLYSTAGIPQFLILNLKAREMEDHRDPSPDGYRSKETYRADESFTLVAFSDISISVLELLPPE
jgi:Uma2 family endonuclease